MKKRRACSAIDRKSTRLNSSHTEIYTLSLHDALPICYRTLFESAPEASVTLDVERGTFVEVNEKAARLFGYRSEEHTSELQSHRDLHSFPTRRSSDLLSHAVRVGT